jgi:hypothetical protein
MIKAVAQYGSLNEVGFNAYVDYLALKRHFTSNYDYHKYGGKIKSSYDSFVIRKDAFSFQRLGKKRDYHNIILSNMVETPKLWIGDLLSQQSIDIHLEWKKRTDAITQHIKDELSQLDDDFQENFKVYGGSYPHIVDLRLRKAISMETFCILVKITNSQEYWSDKVVDKVIFPDIMKTIDDYYPFINFSQEKIKKIIKDHFFG